MTQNHQITPTKIHIKKGKTKKERNYKLWCEQLKKNSEKQK